jgi:two-component system chemotaxis response regulator CheY
MRALIVDDSSTMRAFLRSTLVTSGFEVSEAHDGVECLKLLDEMERPDIALVDWNMPRMDGFELLENLRRRAEFDDMPIVMVTAQIDITHIAAALAAGANEYIMKPLTADILLEKLEMLGF